MSGSHHPHHFHGRFPLAGFAFLLAGAALVMLLWNALVPHLFALPSLGYLQALGLLLLSRLLIGRGPRPFERHAAAGCRAGHEASADPAEPVGP